MGVEPDITRQIMTEELAAMAPLIATYGWEVTTDLGKLLVTVKMKTSALKRDDIYIVEAKCDDYKALPPYFEFIHPETLERGSQRCYPADGSFFHTTPCICVEWNRKAYAVHGGPHSDWQMANWTVARLGMNTLGDMFNWLQWLIHSPSRYKGRMAQ